MAKFSAKLFHSQVVVEFTRNGSLFNPTDGEKLLWELVGLPDNVNKVVKNFDTVVATANGKTKKEIFAKFDTMVNNGELDSLGFAPDVWVVFEK
jgi:hypothetical protein